MATRIDVGLDTPMVGLVRMWPAIVLAGFGALCPAGISVSFAMTAVMTDSNRSEAVLIAVGSGVVAVALIWLTVWLVRKQVRNRRNFTGSRVGLLLDGFGVWWREQDRCFPIAWGELAEVAIGSKQSWGGTGAMDVYFVLTPARPGEFWQRHPQLHEHHDAGAYWIHAPASGLSHGTFRQAVVSFAPHLWRRGAHRNPLAQAQAELADRLVYGDYPQHIGQPPPHNGPRT